MKLGLTIWYLTCYWMLMLYMSSCGKPVKQDSADQNTAKVIKQNSPLDEQKKQKSKEMMEEIYKQLNFISEMDRFLNIINHSKNNHLFVNADHQGYIVAAVKNKGFNRMPDSEKSKLSDTSDVNKPYQLKFLLHHIIPSPYKTYPGLVYRSLAGEEISISENRSAMQLKDKTYRIGSSIKVSENLELITLDSVLFY